MQRCYRLCVLGGNHISRGEYDAIFLIFVFFGVIFWSGGILGLWGIPQDIAGINTVRIPLDLGRPPWHARMPKFQDRSSPLMAVGSRTVLIDISSWMTKPDSRHQKLLWRLESCMGTRNHPHSRQHTIFCPHYRRHHGFYCGNLAVILRLPRSVIPYRSLVATC